MSSTTASPKEIARTAKDASRVLATTSSHSRNEALVAIHDALSAAKDELLAANARDLALAGKAVEAGSMKHSALARLDLGKAGKWEEMLEGILSVRELDDPGRHSSADATGTWLTGQSGS
jgi:glutamate-5-semialdehyde dehydrogenase